jgi:chromosome segregation ATPase
MVKTKILFGVTALLAAFSLGAEAAKLNKWVDKDGVTHYGDVVPPEYADREKVQLEQGHEIKKKPGTSTGDAKPAELTPEQIEQKRHDQALLGTYSSEDEIDLALKRNLQQVDARLSSIQQQIKSTQDDLDRHAKEKADMEKAGKPADKSIMDDIAQANARMTKLQNEQTKVQAESEVIKARFAADKKRYRELAGGKN